MDEKYQKYFASREWSILKEAVKERSKGTCERCKYFPLDAVHHLTYARKYHEELNDLQAICNGCHDFTHAKSFSDPKLKVEWLSLISVVKIQPLDNDHVYLAGKVNGSKHEFAKAIQGKFCCTDGQNHSEHEWGIGYDLNSHLNSCYGNCLFDELDRCCGLIAILDTNNSFGSVAEIAAAAALRKPCYVIFKCDESDIQPYGESGGFFDVYWFVCSLPQVRGAVVNCDEDVGRRLKIAYHTIRAMRAEF